MDVKIVGIIGAGQMGTGISQSLSLADYKVLIYDNSKISLTRAIKKIQEN